MHTRYTLYEKPTVEEGCKSGRPVLAELHCQVERLVCSREADWHRRLLQTVIHLLQASLSLNTADLDTAETELMVDQYRLVLLPSD